MKSLNIDFGFLGVALLFMALLAYKHYEYKYEMNMCMTQYTYSECKALMEEE